MVCTDGITIDRDSGQRIRSTPWVVSSRSVGVVVERQESARVAKRENGHTEQLCYTFIGCRSGVAGWQRACAERSADLSENGARVYLAGAMAVSCNANKSYSQFAPTGTVTDCRCD